jgi:hypothetical protein
MFPGLATRNRARGFRDGGAGFPLFVKGGRRSDAMLRRHRLTRAKFGGRALPRPRLGGIVVLPYAGLVSELTLQAHSAPPPEVSVSYA